MIERYGYRPYAVVHRLIPAGPKHGLMTACRIKLSPTIMPGVHSDSDYGGLISVTEKGLPFDCERCRRVLELRHRNDGFNIPKGNPT